MKGSVATTARGGEMPNITAESAMAFVLAHTVIHNKLLKFQDPVLRVTYSKTCPTNWTYVYVIFLQWRYSLGWALASFTIRLQAS